MEEKKIDDLFDRYYAQDVNEEEETEMAGYGVYGAYSAGCC